MNMEGLELVKGKPREKIAEALIKAGFSVDVRVDDNTGTRRNPSIRSAEIDAKDSEGNRIRDDKLFQIVGWGEDRRGMPRRTAKYVAYYKPGADFNYENLDGTYTFENGAFLEVTRVLFADKTTLRRPLDLPSLRRGGWF